MLHKYYSLNYYVQRKTDASYDAAPKEVSSYVFGTYIKMFDLNSKKWIKRIGFLSLLCPELKSSRSVENEHQPQRRQQLTNVGSKKRGPTAAFSRLYVVYTFSSAANSCVVTTINEISVSFWMKSVWC
jgi:hypothetical protein